jgi:murein L,D-transpeptidase YcbB/YkuD
MALALIPSAAGAQPDPVIVPPPPVALPSPPPSFRSDQIALLMQTLIDARTHGFGRDEFMPPGLDGLLRSPNASDRLRGAILLKSAILSYAKAQHGGRLPASAFLKNWGMRPGPYDPEVEFNFALAQDRLPQWLDTLAPPFDRYRGLKDALAQYRAIAARGGWSEIEDGPKLGLGSSGSRVLALRQRLALEDAQSDLDASGSTFDQSLVEAVQHFQHNVGLDSTGVVDKYTLAALNVPVERRVLQIEANMERWRWVPRIWPATRIEANIAAEEMSAFQDNALVLEMRAAPGRPDDQTPILSSQVESVVFDPPWNVPSSIATKELWPKEAAHPGYLASHGYRIISTGDDGGRRIQQSYGPKSALGSIKFDFPNAYAVYLHDTPSHAAFGRTSRAVSHGCVRLQRPKELANLLFQGDSDWTPERIDEVIADGKTIRAPLDKPEPIFIMYWTAFLDVKGRVNFRDDVYGWDETLMGLIAAARNRA